MRIVLGLVNHLFHEDILLKIKEDGRSMVTAKDEKLIAYDENGKIVWTKSGEYDKIVVGPEDLGLLKDCYTLHNHPFVAVEYGAEKDWQNKEWKGAGQSFSGLDLFVSLVGEVKGQFVVTQSPDGKKWLYGMLFPDKSALVQKLDNKPHAYKMNVARAEQAEWERVQLSVRRQYREYPLLERVLTIDHETNKFYSQANGLIYWREAL